MRENAHLVLSVNARRIRSAVNAPLVGVPAAAWSRRQEARIYFDTPRLRLHHHGIVVSLRRSGRRWQQTVERAPAPGSSTVDHPSVRRFVRAGLPQLTPLDVPVLGAVLDGEPAQIVLRRVFETHIETTCRRIAVAPRVRIAVCIARGSIRSRKHEQQVSEVELTLLAGQKVDLFEFARRLRATVPFVIEHHSQIERGYALRDGNLPVPAKAAHLALGPDMSVADACCTIAAACLAQFEANQQGMLRSTDTEFLHQMRVALRRLGSAIALFQYAIPQQVWSAAIADIRWLGRALGPARDWDVLTTERLPEIARHFTHEPGMTPLLRKCMENRLRAVARARRAVRSARCQCFLLALAEAIESRAWLPALNVLERETTQQNIVPYAASMLEQRYQLVRKRGRSIGRLNDGDLHRLRIAVKKLRYAADFFGALFDGVRFGEFRSAATALQEALGQINDVTTANAMLAAVNEPPQRALTTACTLLAGWNRHEVHRLKAGLVEIWQVFCAAPHFWRDTQTGPA